MKLLFFGLLSIAVLKIGYCALKTPCDVDIFKLSKNFRSYLNFKFVLFNSCGINWIEFRNQANTALVFLCAKINDLNTSPTVHTSATNIHNNIKDLGDATITIAAGILRNCIIQNLNCDAASIAVEDFARRIKCFNTVLHSTDASIALTSLGLCVQDSEKTSNDDFEKRTPLCKTTALDTIANGLKSIQAYYTGTFVQDLHNFVASNTPA